MDTSKTIVDRILMLCKERGITVNHLRTMSAVRKSTINDIISRKTQSAGIITIKKLCDGLDISLAEFFNTEEFRNLEQEIK